MFKFPLPRSIYFFWKQSYRGLSTRQLYNQLFKYFTTHPPCSHVYFHGAQIHSGTGKHSFQPCWCIHAGSHRCPSNTHLCLRNTQQGWVSILAVVFVTRKKKGLAQCFSPEKDKLRHSHSSQYGSFMIP